MLSLFYRKIDQRNKKTNMQPGATRAQQYILTLNLNQYGRILMAKQTEEMIGYQLQDIFKVHIKYLS
jgi:hypothetical protein